MAEPKYKQLAWDWMLEETYNPIRKILPYTMLTGGSANKQLVENLELQMKLLGWWKDAGSSAS